MFFGGGGGDDPFSSSMSPLLPHSGCVAVEIKDSFFSRFDDASYYYWILSVQFADLAREGIQPEEMIARFYEYQQKASIYYAYHTIQR